MQNQTCFLLSYVKYGDQDAILHCFSSERGYQSFFAKGIYSSKNKKKPYLFPLNLLNITVARGAGNKTLPPIAKLEPAADSYDFNDVKVNSMLFFTADFLHQILREEHQNQRAFDEIMRFKEQVEASNPISHLSLIFQFLKVSGIAPLLQDGRHLNPESGTFTPEISHPFFTADISSLWRVFLKSENPYEIQLRRNERNAFLDSLMIYYHLHFTGFYTPNSLGVLRQIYE
ncbi:MAG: recombination protein O N-terminal domain-containing protein [Flavobacteriia bacterium]|nr:recombination protein O N-terminal domain-containing protein [Flavobacteriia bacterium]MBH2023338.1 recombination protein O N-terminal domain-containing protein [Flavobacteriales bacterium]